MTSSTTTTRYSAHADTNRRLLTSRRRSAAQGPLREPAAGSSRLISRISFSTTGLNRYASTIAIINGISVLSAADQVILTQSNRSPMLSSRRLNSMSSAPTQNTYALILKYCDLVFFPFPSIRVLRQPSAPSSFSLSSLHSS